MEALPTLMLVEDPRDTILTLCQFKEKHVTWDSYKAAYKKIKNLTKISKGNIDCHFYTLTQFKLLKKVNNSNKYVISSIGKRLCKLLHEDNTTEYQVALKTILINNEKKGILFTSYLKHLQNIKIDKKTTLNNIFRPETNRAIISWLLEANVIRYNKDTENIWLYDRLEQLDKLTLNIFSDALYEIYQELQESDIFYMDKVFVDINELRDNVCMKLGIEITEFDNYLSGLIKSSNELIIRLYGGPSSTFETKRNFIYNKKIYAYIRIRK